MAIQFYLGEICSQIQEKLINQRNTLRMQRIVFQDCSSELIEEVIKFFYSQEWKADRTNKIEYILFKNCYINDFKLIKLIQRFDYFYSQRFEAATQKNKQDSAKQDDELISFSNVEILIDNCPNITSYFFSYLENWTVVQNTTSNVQSNYLTDFTYERVKNFQFQHTKLAIKDFQNDLSNIDLIKFSTTIYFKYLSSLKLKNFAVTKPTILKEMLSSKFQPKFKESDAENQSYNQQNVYGPFCSRLQILSVDTTVCDSFDSLPLHEEYWVPLRKLSFENRSEDNNEYHDITFQKMVSYSLSSLIILKLKRCNLTAEFFQTLAKMDCVLNIRQLSFERCKIDLKAFKTFLYHSKITENLQYLNLTNTNITDDVCFTIQEQFSNKMQLKGIDVSRCQKLTHKGIKYLSLITSLRQLNIEYLENAVTDSFSFFIIDLLLKKQKKFYETYIEDDQVQLMQEIDTQRETQISNTSHYSTVIYDIQRILDKKTSDEKKDQQAPLQNVAAQKSQQNDQNDKEKDKKEITAQMVIHDPSKAQDLSISHLTNILAEIKNMKEKEIQQIKDTFNQKKEEIKLQFKEKRKNYLKNIKQLLHYEDLPTINYLNLNKNTKVTSVFLDELNNHGFLNRLQLLSVQDTMVNGHIFKILQNKPQIKESQPQDESNNKDESKKQEKEIKQQIQLEIEPTIPNVTEKGDLKPILEEEKVDNASQKPSTASAAEGINNTNLQNTPFKEDSEKQLLSKKENVEENNEIIIEKQEDDDKKKPSTNNSLEQRKLQQQNIKKKILNLADQQKHQIEVKQQKTEPDNYYLKYLDLTGCMDIQPSCFEILFDTYFENLEVLKLVQLNFYDNQFYKFTNNMNNYFKKLKILNLAQSQINRFAIKQFFEKVNIPLVEINMNQCKVDEECIQSLNSNLKENLVKLSLSQCFIYDSKHLQDLLNLMKNNICFDYNQILKQYNHLISKKMLYDIVKNYLPLENQHVLDLTSAAFCDIDVTYWNHNMRYQDQKINQNSKLEALIVDDTRIDFDLLFMILRQHCNIYHISCKNTPNFKMQKYIENKSTKKVVQVGFEQMAQVLNDKSLEFQESSWISFISSKFKKKHTRYQNENIILNLRFQQQIQKQKLRSLIDYYKDFITKINFENSKIDDSVLENISSGGKTITRLYIKGCNNITKAGIIRLSESKKLSPKFDLECILELKHLIDMEVMQSIAQSPYLKNIVYLDLSNLQLSNIDDGIMKICLSSSEVLLNIRVLDLSNTWTSDRGLQIISVTQKLRKLEKIYYSDCKKITERGIAYILDSGTLERLDISHFIGQSPDKFNGKVLDNLKYSNRKAFFRELNFQDSLFVDKELNNMFYDISKMFNIKYLDLRRTPNIGDEGLKLVHQTKLEQFQILLLDFQRYDKLIPPQFYIDAVKKIEQLQLQNISTSEKAAAQKIASVPINENPNQKQNKDIKNLQGNPHNENDNFVMYTKTSLLQYPPFSFSYSSNGIEEFEERRKKIKSLYNFEKLQPKQITDTNTIQILRQDNFFQDIFINSKKIKEFRFDFFIFKHNHLFEDNIIYSLGLSRFCDYHKKNTTTRLDNKVPERNQQKEQTEDLNFKNELRNIKYMKYLDLSNAKQVSNKAFCILFMNFEVLGNVEHINLSHTQIDEDVILSIAASQQMINLKTILFDNCPQIKDISTAFIYLVLGSKKNQMILRNSQNNNFNYNKQMDQVNQASNNNTANNKNQQNKNNDQQKNKEQEENSKVETFSYFDYYGLFQYYCTYLNAAAINLFMKIHSMKQKLDEKISIQKGSQVKQRHIYGLNLEGCHLKGIAQLQIPKEVMIINLSLTNIDYPDLKLFLPYTKYLWIDQTFNIKDENFVKEIQPMLEYTQPKFSHTEFLYSKSYSLNKGAKLLIHILEKYDIKYIDLNHFRQMSHSNIKALLTNEKIYNKLRSIKIDFRQLHHVKLLSNILDTLYKWCDKDQLFQLLIDKITIEQQYKQLDKEISVNESIISKIKQKLVIDNNITKGFPFIIHPFKKMDYNKSEQQKEEENIIKNYFDVVYKPFQLQDLRLGGLNISKNQAQSLLKLLQQGNQLRKLVLDELPFVNDDFIIENLVCTQKVEHGQEVNTFCYLQILTLAKTRVTERSFINILTATPFSINFKLSMLLESLQKDSSFTFTNYTLEALSNSRYLLNVTNLDTSNFDYVSHILCKLFDSKYAVNIQTISLNYKLLNEQVFIKLASTKMLPNLVKIDLTNCSKCNQFFHYLIRAKYINIQFSIKDIVEEPGIISCTPFLLSIIDSTYMRQIQVLTIDNIDHDINQLEQIFLVSNYLFNLKNLSINCQRDSASNEEFWSSIADSNKIPQLEQLSVKKLITSNLKIMIQQKFKPRVQIDKLLYDNQEYLDDECFAILSEQPHLINITEIDLSKLNVSKREISSTTLLKLFLSKYCFNIQKIILGEDKLGDRSKIGIEQDLVATEYITEYLREQKKLFNEAEFKLIDIQIYKTQEISKAKTQEQPELKKEGLYEKFLMFNNLKNLKEIQFLSKDLLDKRYLYLISKKSLHKMFSTQFDFGLFIYQLSDLFFQLKDVDLYEYFSLISPEIDLHGWFQQRQKVLFLDFFQPFLGAYEAISQAMRRVDDFSCIEEIRFQSRQSGNFNLHYMIYCEGWGIKAAFLNLQKITISFQLYKKLDISTSSINQTCNFLNRPFMQYKLFDCGHFLDLLITNINLENQPPEYLMQKLSTISPVFLQNIQDMVFYTDLTSPLGALQDILNLPYLSWKTISIRARGKDRDENQITSEEKDIQDKILNIIITKGYTKLKNSIENLELITKISFEQYYSLEINNILSKSFNRLEFIEKRVDQSTLIKQNQIIELRKNNAFYYNQYSFFVPSMKLEEKKKKQEKQAPQNNNAVSQAPGANGNQQQQNQHDKSTQQQQGKNNQQQQKNNQKDQKQGDHQQNKQQEAQQQQQLNQSAVAQEQAPPQSYLQQFQIHRMTRLNKLIIKANLEWVDFAYLYEKVMVNNPNLNVQFESRNHKPMIEYIKNTNKEGKDWTLEFKYIQQLFSDDKEKKKEQIIQAIVSNESAKYFLLRLDQGDKNSKVPFASFLYNAFKAFRSGLDTEIKEIGPTQALVQIQTKQQFNTPNNNNNNNNNTNNSNIKNNNQKQNNNAANKQNQNNQQNNNAVNQSSEQAIVNHPISAKKKKKPLSVEFYITQIEFLDTIDYSKEQEFLNCFPCLLEITFDKYEKSTKVNDKLVENTLNLLQICRNPITIQNIFCILAPFWQQKHLKQISNLEFVKANVFFISFKNNSNIQIRGVEDRKINILEENQTALDKVQSQFVKENNEDDQNENQNQLGDDNINFQNLKSSEEKSDILSQKSSEKGDPLIKKSVEEFEDYDQEIQKNITKNQQNDNYNQEDKKDEQKGQEEEKDNEEENKFQEEKGKNKNRVFINEKDLLKFLRSFYNLQELDLSQSSISKEHFQVCFESQKNNLNFNCVIIQGCEVADPEGYLLSVIKFLQETHVKGQKGNNQQNKQQGKKNRRHFQLERFIQSISFEINTVMNLKFIKTLIQSNHFMSTIKFLKLKNLFNAYAQSSELKQIILPFLQSQNLDTSAFLQQNDIQSQIDDDLIVELTKQKDNIGYISPDTFINVKYGFNLLLQQKCIDFDEKLLYFLNTSFQKSLSGTSFYEVYQFIHDQNMLKNSDDYTQSMDKDLFNLVKIYVQRNEYYLQQTQKFMNQKDPVFVDTSKDQYVFLDIKSFLTDKNIQIYNPSSLILRQSYLLTLQDSREKYLQAKKKNQLYYEELESQKQYNEMELKNTNKLTIEVIRNKSFKDYQKDKERFILKFSRYTNHLDYLIDQYYNKMQNLIKQESRQIYLLDFIENLNLKNNSFFNYSGLNNYITNHITPWLKLNNGISKIKESKNLRSTKVIDENSAQKDSAYSKLISPDHSLDDKILLHLLFIIEQDLNNLRSIELIGLNVSDLFAQRLSNVLSDSYKLQKLMLLDLSNNNRLTSYGMKYIYSSIVDRVKQGLNIILTSNKQEMESIELILEDIKERIELINTFIKERNEKLIEQLAQNTPAAKNIFSAISIQKKGSLEKLELLENKQEIEEEQVEQAPPQEPQQQEEAQVNQEPKPEEKQENGEEEKKEEEKQEVGLIRQSAAPKQQEQKIDSVKLYGWKPLEDPLTEELSYLEQKYEKYMDLYKQCQKEVSELGEQAQIASSEVIAQSLVNVGFYEFINRQVAKKWKEGRYFFVIFSAIFLWFISILQITLFICFKVQEFVVKKYELHKLKKQSQFTFSKEGQLQIRVIKKVPLILQQDDFYFDEDILTVNYILGCTSFNIEENEERQRLLRVQKFLMDPCQQNKHLISKQKERNVGSYTLTYAYQILIVTYFLYLIGFILVSTILQIYTPLTNECNSMNIYWDVAYYIYSIISVTFETLLCLDVQYIVGSKKICNISYFSLVLRLFFSFVLKYDQYTDIQFSIFLYNCQQYDLKRFGIVQACFIICSLVKDFKIVCQYLYELYRDRSEHDYEKLPNTYFINLFTGLALSIQMNAFSKLLEKFSTVGLSYVNIRVPFEFLHLLWRIFFANTPTLFIYFYIYFSQIGDFNISSWADQRIFVTSILSFCYCVHQAWVTKPSNFTSYQMKENLDFVSMQEESYSLKINYENKISYYQYDELFKKLKVFIEINQLIFKQNYRNFNKQSLQKLQQQQEDQKNNVIDSQKNLVSQANIQSARDLWNDYDQFEDSQQPDILQNESKSKEFQEKIKALEEKQSKDFSQYQDNLLRFLIYKKLNWEQFNQRGLFKGSGEKDEGQNEIDKKTQFSNKEEPKQN